MSPDEPNFKSVWATHDGLTYIGWPMKRQSLSRDENTSHQPSMDKQPQLHFKQWMFV